MVADATTTSHGVFGITCDKPISQQLNSRCRTIDDEMLTYSALQARDAEAVVHLLAAAFSAGEPPAVAMGLSYDDLATFVRQLIPCAADAGLSAVARPLSGGDAVGVMLNDDFGRPFPVNSSIISEKFLPIFSMLAELDDRYKESRAIGEGQCLHLFMLAVDPRFTGQGVAQRLVETSLELAKTKGYRYAVTEATGLISQWVFRKLGFEERFRISYADYKYREQAVFASIVAHDGTALMERSL